jgi:hypothetical protein
MLDHTRSLASWGLTRSTFPSCCSFYYDCLMKPNAKSVTTALRKVGGLEAKECRRLRLRRYAASLQGRVQG